MSDSVPLQRRTTETQLLPNQHVPPLKASKFLFTPPALTIVIFNVILIIVLILFVVFFPNDDKFALLWKNDPKTTPITPTPPTDTKPPLTPSTPSTDERQASTDPTKEKEDNTNTAPLIDRTGCPLMCPMVYQPVCASNGMTFGNTCQLSAYNKCDRPEGQPLLTVVSEGECPDRVVSPGLRNPRNLNIEAHPQPDLDTI